MNNYLFIDCSNSGISGDMFLAALLDLISNQKKIITQLEELPRYLQGTEKLEIRLEKITRSGVLVNQLKITLREKKHHRSGKVLREALNAFLEDKGFSKEAGSYANEVLLSLLKAEAEVHGKLIEQIHLHELSSVDTLIDIIGATFVLEQLGYFKGRVEIACSEVPLGGGTIKAAHGILPVPAPATSNILQKANFKVKTGPIDSELTTPTGAALLTSLSPSIKKKAFKIHKVASGAGQKEFKSFINVLRIFHGEISGSRSNKSSLTKYIEPVMVLETDVDDVSGEILGHFIQKLEKEKILDVQLIPTLTKKSRPGHIIKVLCMPEDKFNVMEFIIKELGTLGVRFNEIQRTCIDRKIDSSSIELNGIFHEFRYKVSFIETDEGQKIINVKPEYEDLKLISERSGICLRELRELAISKLKSLNLDAD